MRVSPIPARIVPHPTGAMAFHPVIPVCPGCVRAMGHPCTRSCERVGCPVKHLGCAAHHLAQGDAA